MHIVLTHSTAIPVSVAMAVIALSIGTIGVIRVLRGER